jgi:hypothetical protein
VTFPQELNALSVTHTLSTRFFLILSFYTLNSRKEFNFLFQKCLKLPSAVSEFILEGVVVDRR